MATMDYSKQSPFNQREGDWLTATSGDDILNWKSSNTRRFRAALAKGMAGVATCEIACIGESTTAGWGELTTNFAYPHYMRETLRNMGVPIGGNGPAFLQHGSTAIKSNFVTLTGTWTQVAQAMYISTTNTIATCTVTGTGTVMQITYSQSGTGSFSYALDGGGAVTVANSGTTALAYITLTGLAPGAHSVVIKSVNSIAAYIYAVEFKETSGVIVGNYGVSSTKVSAWNTSTYYQNGNVVAFRAPALAILQLNVNDLIAATSVEAYKAGLKLTVEKLLPTTDVVLGNSNPATGAWTQEEGDAYERAIYELALEMDIPLFSFGNRFPTQAEADSMGLMIDSVHPNRNYHALRGNHHARAILT